MTAWILSSSLLILAIVLLRQLLRGHISRRLQYALWALVLFRLLCPVSLGESTFSIMNAAETSQVIQDIDALENYDSIWYTGDGTVEGYPADTLMPDTPQVVAEYQSPADFQRMEYILSLRKALTILWICGVAVMTILFLASNAKFRRSLENAAPHTYENCPLPVLVTDNIESPCLFGLLNPTIYMPEHVWNSPDTCRHAIAHEETHYRHFDHIWAILRCIALALHWYNPLVWLAVRLSRQDSELACDEGTIARLGDAHRLEYGHTLLDLTCGKRSALCTATTMLDDKGQLKERITAIARKSGYWRLAVIPVTLILAVLAITAFTDSKSLGPVPTLVPGEPNPKGFQLTYAGSPIEELTAAIGEETYLDLKYDPSLMDNGLSCSTNDARVCTIAATHGSADGTKGFVITIKGVGHATVTVRAGTLMYSVDVIGIESWGAATPAPEYHPEIAVKPEDFQDITRVQVRWNVGTLFNSYPNSGDITFIQDERTAFMEQLLRTSVVLSEPPHCPMGPIMDIYTTQRHLTIQLPYDNCPIWMSEGIYYRYDAPDNTGLYSVFSGGVIHMSKQNPTYLFPLLPYLNWTYLPKEYGIEAKDVLHLMEVIEGYVIYCDDIPTRVYRMNQVLQCTDGLPPELEALFGDMLARICNHTPGQFSAAVLENISAADREEVIRLLAQAWDTNLVTTRKTLEGFRERYAASATPKPTPLYLPDEIPKLSFTGTWSDTPTITQIGPDSDRDLLILQSISFSDDGTGVWSTLMGDLPAIERPFTYGVGADQLHFDFDDGTAEIYTYALTNHTLMLESPRITMHLERTE